MAQKQSTPRVLDLDSLQDRAVVKIDGTAFELRNYQEFSVIEGVKLQRLSRRFQEVLVNAANATDAELDEVSKLLAQIKRLIFIDAPAHLTDQQMQEVLGFFSQQIKTQKQPTTANEQKSPNGEKSSQGSAASTVDDRANG